MNGQEMQDAVTEVTCQDHMIAGDLSDKVEQFVVLQRLTEAMQLIGWHRHTSDWDWFADVTMSDGRELHVGGDDFNVVGLTDRTVISTDFYGLVQLEVSVLPEVGEEYRERLMIRDIVSFNLYYDT